MKVPLEFSFELNCNQLPMDQIWNALNKSCDENEANLVSLEECSSRLPKEPRSWFYLKPNFLCPPVNLSDSNGYAPAKDYEESFISVFQVSEPANNQDVPGGVLKESLANDSTPVSQVNELHTKNLESVLGDPDFPESVLNFIKRKELEPTITLSETDTVSFCRYLLHSQMFISEATGIQLFNLILYPVICNVQKMFLSVLLLEKIRELTNSFPVFMMNGVIMPAISKDNLEKQELDILCDILVGLSEENLGCTLKSFLTSLKRTDDCSVRLLATVFKTKPKLDNEMAFILVTKLQNLSGQFSSSIQFGKLLLEVLPLLNSKLSESSLKVLKDVLEHHTTFLKTSALKLFNNLEHI